MSYNEPQKILHMLEKVIIYIFTIHLDTLKYSLLNDMIFKHRLNILNRHVIIYISTGHLDTLKYSLLNDMIFKHTLNI